MRKGATAKWREKKGEKGRVGEWVIQKCWRRFVIGAQITTFLVKHGLQIRASDVP